MTRINVTKPQIPDRTCFHAGVDQILDLGWLTNRGQCIRELESKLEMILVKAISTAEFPALTKRPINSVLDCDRFEISFNKVVKLWIEPLYDVINE